MRCRGSAMAASSTRRRWYTAAGPAARGWCTSGARATIARATFSSRACRSRRSTTRQSRPGATGTAKPGKNTSRTRCPSSLTSRLVWASCRPPGSRPLRRWLVTYQLADPRGVWYRTAQNPTGPYSAARLLYHPDWPGVGYGSSCTAAGTRADHSPRRRARHGHAVRPWPRRGMGRRVRPLHRRPLHPRRWPRTGAHRLHAVDLEPLSVAPVHRDARTV